MIRYSLLSQDQSVTLIISSSHVRRGCLSSNGREHSGGHPVVAAASHVADVKKELACAQEDQFCPLPVILTEGDDPG